MTQPDHVAIGTWSGGRFMRFGEPIDEDRLVSLLRPGDGISTVLTADVYGEGEADRLLARALNGIDLPGYAGLPDSGAPAGPPIRSSSDA